MATVCFLDEAEDVEHVCHAIFHTTIATACSALPELGLRLSVIRVHPMATLNLMARQSERLIRERIEKETSTERKLTQFSRFLLLSHKQLIVAATQMAR